MRTKCPSAFVAASFLAVTTPFSAISLTLPSSGLTAAKSGNNFVLSFPTASSNYYGLQTSSDLLQSWTNIQSGIPGDGTVKSVTITDAMSVSRRFYRLVIQPKPVGLLLPQSNAFAILGHSCGGIQEQVYATGFVGYPTGDVYIQTRCGGSGRGGGYQETTYSAWVAVTWDFSGNVISSTTLSNAPAINSSFSVTDGFGDILFNTGANAFLIVPVPAAPTDVTAVQSGDQFQVSWIPKGVNPLAITSSTLTATPINSTNSILTAIVTGPVAIGDIPSLQPQTTYQVTVADTTIGGSGPASTPVTVTTEAATVAPSAPANVVAKWTDPNPAGTNDTLVATWSAAVPGDSPIDEYQITITGSDGGGTFTQTVSGTTLTTYFTVDYIPNWTVTVKAHNAVGWGPSSTPVTLGGL
jgi:hypothetical protein